MNYTRTGLSAEQQAELCFEQKAEIERLEAEVVKLKQQVEKMKCCENCKDFCYGMCGGSEDGCDDYNKWEWEG